MCDVFDEDTLALMVEVSFAGLAEFSEIVRASAQCVIVVREERQSCEMTSVISLTFALLHACARCVSLT